MDRIGELLGQLTLEEKAELLSGRDFWNLKGVERLGLPSICITDGPHGVRKTGGSHASLSVNEEATCFPTACAAACSFDEALLEELGRALGRECREKSVAVLLGPGANIKRSPLGGRNFEYFSEDPLVSGKLAAAVIRGMESMNVGASLKHFAANNQERCRMVGSSQVDERALREIYLAGFETAVREGKPATVMCSYNRINEVYACESRRLLTEILREEWGFEGLVVTDWGGMDRRVEALEAGCDLEMPGDAPENTRLVLKAVRSGRLSVETLDRAVERILRLIVREMGNPPLPADRAAHHALAGRIAGESGVLVQNDGTLPLKPGQRVALIGRFARYPRYQGSGSSRIEPTRITSAEETFLAAGVAVRYAEGYGEAEIQPELRAWFDVTLMSRLLQNLLDNAARYGRENGHIWVTLRREDDGIALSVRDDGIGIAQDQQTRIWQRFYQVDPARSGSSGSGLGLTMVQQIAHLHGGRVTAASTPARGSCFTLQFPAEQPTAPEEK